MRAAERAAGRILILDDHEANVLLLERLLRHAGYEQVLGLTDPRRFEDELARFQPDLVMLDLHMPHRDGFQILERLGDAPRDDYLPVVVLTADVDPASRQRALAMGAADFVTKPFDPTEVTLRTRNLLQTRFLHRQLAERNQLLAAELVERTDEAREARAARQTILASLNRPRAGATLDEIAAAICAEFSKSPSFDVVGVLGFSEDGIVPIAVQGPTEMPSVPRTGIPPHRAAELRDRARSGGWHTDWQGRPEDVEFGQWMAARRLRVAWYAVLEGDRGPAGLLAAASIDEVTEAEREARLRLLAEYAAVARALLVPGLLAIGEQEQVRAQLLRIIADRDFHSVFQPIVNIGDGQPIAFEALTRFADGMRPDQRFAEAHRLGVGVDLEIATLARALEESHALPVGSWVTLNVSPAVLSRKTDLPGVLRHSERPVVLEITEHEAITEYAPLREALQELGSAVRLAIDDAGAGFASFRHILELRPDFVKLDSALVRSIEADHARQALIVGMRYFAEKTRCALIAEGVETEAERAMLESLGIHYAQGYLFGRPQPAVASVHKARRPVLDHVRSPEPSIPHR